MAKFSFRGKSWEEISEMKADEFQTLLKSKTRRSLKRGLKEDHKKFLARVAKDKKKFHRIKNRSLVILPEIVGTKIGVYNGKEYVSLTITQEMIGHRLGEFVPTRKPVKHSDPGFGATRSSKYIPLK